VDLKAEYSAFSSTCSQQKRN